MAENLSYKTENSWCYGDDEANCKKYGRLYTSASAQNACPSGWHLPSRDEWHTLIEYAGGENDLDKSKKLAGKKLKSTGGWSGERTKAATDDYGFSALPAGFCEVDKGELVGYNMLGESSLFWTSTTESRDVWYYQAMSNDGDNVGFGATKQGYGSSVRCMKDQTAEQKAGQEAAAKIKAEANKPVFNPPVFGRALDMAISEQRKQGVNPAVLTQPVDYPFITSVDQGIDYIFTGGGLFRLKLHLAKNGEVSVGYATDTHIHILEYSKDLKLVKTMTFKHEWSVEEMRKEYMNYDINGKKKGLTDKELAAEGFQHNANDVVITEGSISPAFTKDDDGNYYFFYARDVRESMKDVENMAIVKYDSSGKKLKTFRLKASDLNAKRPSPGRIEVSGDALALFFDRTMFEDKVEGFGFSHSGSVGFYLDKNTMTPLLDKNTMEPIGGHLKPGSSHSLGRSILPVEGGFAFVDACDGDPDRAFLISAFIFGKVNEKNKRSFSFKLGSAYQVIFSQLGGLAQTPNGYVFAGGYEKNNIVAARHNDSRNLFVLTMGDKLNNMSQPIWITNYTDKEKENAASPRIVGLGDGRCLLMWELFSYRGYVTTYMTIIDHTGKRLIPDKELPGVRLSRPESPRYDKASGNVYWAANGNDMDINVYSFNPDKPIKNPARLGAPIDGYGLLIRDLTSEKTTAAQNEVFTVKATLHYELWEKMPPNQVGAALVDKNNNIAAIIGTYDDKYGYQAGNLQMGISVAGTALAGGVGGGGTSYTRKATIKNAFVPESVKPGEYRLRAAIKLADANEWRLITLPEGKALEGNSISAIPFTVTAARKNTAGITLERFSPKKTEHVIQEEAFTTSVQLKNNASSVFSGDVGAVLTDDAGKIVQVIGTKSISNIKGQATNSTTIDCTVPRSVKEGRYTLRIAVKQSGGKDWEFAPSLAFEKGVRSDYSFNVVAKKATVEDYGFVLEGFKIEHAQRRTAEEAAKEPTLRAIKQGEAFAGSYRLTYTEKYATGGLKGDVGIALMDNADNIAAFIYTRDDGALSASIQKLIVPKTVAPGEYKVRVMIRLAGKEWRIVKYVVSGIVNDIPLTVMAGE